MTDKKSILFILTSHDQLGNTGKKTGWYLSEVAHPYYVLKSHYNIVFASPKGGEAPLDPGSVEAFKDDPECKKFLADKDAEQLWKNTVKVEEFIGKENQFAAVFFPGGHGPMFDLPNDKASKHVAAKIYANGGLLTAVCHGPAGIINIAPADAGDSKDTTPIISGKRVTGFSNDEERTVKLENAVPFMLEDALKKSGAKFEKAKEQWDAFVIVDGRIVTGQNPSSATGVAEKIVELVGK
ncbi:hypothetical protein HDU85_003701 [Gaertneriomyces sp. JEL0708]|nr:hypothetical protein HDU85_003701 [Gaertneriomyces sp. JEL0708]